MMTVIGEGVSGGDAMSQNLRQYYLKAEELSEFFSNRLTPGERWYVLKEQATPLVIASIGYLGATIGLRLITGVALAQTRSDKTLTAFGLTQYEWSVAINVTYNVVVIAILLTLIAMIVRGTRSHWVWRTASFLLGFLVKSIASFPSG
jgi:hypothetical protein